MSSSIAPALHGTITRPLSTRRRRSLAAIEAVVGVNALSGMAYALAGAPDVPAEWLSGTPFDSYVVPGVYLGVVVGGTCLLGAYSAARDLPGARAAALVSTAVLETWIAAQVVMIGYHSPLQPIIAAAGLAVAALAARP